MGGRGRSENVKKRQEGRERRRKGWKGIQSEGFCHLFDSCCIVAGYYVNL
jgi:hypothetical protein